MAMPVDGAWRALWLRGPCRVQELVHPNAADCSSDEDDEEKTVATRFWARRALYFAGQEKADSGEPAQMHLC